MTRPLSPEQIATLTRDDGAGVYVKPAPVERRNPWAWSVLDFAVLIVLPLVAGGYATGLLPPNPPQSTADTSANEGPREANQPPSVAPNGGK